MLFFKAGRSLFVLLPPGIEMGSAILLARGNLKKNALDHCRRASMPCKGGAEIPLVTSCYMQTGVKTPYH